MTTPCLYKVNLPGDDNEMLEWYEVYPTKRQAMNHARRYASDVDGEQWEVVYIPVTSDDNDTTYWGKQTIVVEQLHSVYHGT